MGMSLPGPVEHPTGRIVSPPMMTGWDGVTVPALLEPRLGVPVLVENDVNAMVWGEHVLAEEPLDLAGEGRERREVVGGQRRDVGHDGPPGERVGGQPLDDLVADHHGAGVRPVGPCERRGVARPDGVVRIGHAPGAGDGHGRARAQGLVGVDAHAQRVADGQPCRLGRVGLDRRLVRADGPGAVDDGDALGPATGQRVRTRRGGQQCERPAAQVVPVAGADVLGLGAQVRGHPVRHARQQPGQHLAHACVLGVGLGRVLRDAGRELEGTAAGLGGGQPGTRALGGGGLGPADGHAEGARQHGDEQPHEREQAAVRRRPAGEEDDATHGDKVAAPCDTNDETDDARGNDRVTPRAGRRSARTT
ncbi:ROK family protein [Promicromonospora citrea]|uniref:ROK family protein n=1 Tax=Promicromonospora citrea TaxID=43677 RepID=UPI0035E274B1